MGCIGKPSLFFIMTFISATGHLNRKTNIEKVSDTVCVCASVVSDSVRPHDSSPLGSAISGMLQARTLEETRVQSLGWEDPLGEGMATYSSALSWRIPGTVEPGGLPSWGRTESDTTEAT